METKKIFIILLIFCLGNIFFLEVINAAPEVEKITNVEKTKMNLDFRNIAVRDLLQIISQFAGKNIIVSEMVTGNISINFTNISWKEALQNIVKMENLSMQEKDNVIFVDSKNISSSNRSGIISASEKQTYLFTVHYTKATDLLDILTKSHNLLSADGNVVTDPRTNSLWINDQAQRIESIRHYLEQIDVPIKQVMIEARIVYADSSFVRDLGLTFGSSVSESTQNSGTLGMNMDLPTKFDVGYATFAIAKLGEGRLLDLELAALESEGRGRIVSSPKLITANREPAYIESGDEVPYQEKTSSGATSVTFKKAVLGLKVTPEITKTNQVDLHIQLNQDKVSTSNINGVPAIQTRQIQTQVSIPSGQTVVLGGIYEESSNNAVHRVPFLSAIPLLGLLFQSKQTQMEHKELLIFVTPRVI